MDKDRLILHRGYKGKYPENSEIAILNAIRENLPFEIDIRLSREGTPFIIHDSSLERLTNRKGEVSSYSDRILKSLLYLEDTKSRLITLEEVCSLIRNYGFRNRVFVHIKSPADVSSVMSVLGNYSLEDNIRFFACDELTLPLMRIIKEKYPSYKVGLHFNDNSHINETEFKLADFIWADETYKNNITSELIKFAHFLNKPIYAISPELINESIFNKNIEKKWKELLENGIDGICTDKPLEFIEYG